MNKTKIIVIGALMAAIAVIFQTLPILLSEVFIFLTVLSAVPIYIASRVKPVAGVLSFLVAAILMIFISTHEALFFICTNGIVGMSLGICRYIKLKKAIILLICPLALTISLSIMNYGIGIPVFGSKIPGAFLVQLLILFLFSLVYILIYLLFADFLYKRLEIPRITESSSSSRKV